MAVTTRGVFQWHGVLNASDEMASEPASVDLLCMLTAFIRPMVVVEAGTYAGHAALAMANVLRHVNPEGKVYTSDVVDSVSGLLKKSAAFLAPYVEFYHGDFVDMLHTVPGEIDLAYIDASDAREPNLRMRHASAVWPRMRPGGLVLVDDTESKDWAGAKVFRDWAKCGGLHLTQQRGLTIIQRPQDDS